LERRFPGGRSRIARSELTWTGQITPSPLSSTYTVRVRYKLGKRPKVQVLEPDLDTPEGTRPPHVFKDGSLCLHQNGEWAERMLLAEIIVPWASEWLLHYEIWLVTGEWHGGGIHPR
jgi:hypothetical protein